MNMNKKVLLLGATLMASLLSAKELSFKEVQEIAKLDMLVKSQIIVEKAYLENNIYMLKTNIRGQAQTIFLTKDKKNLIAGKVYNTKTSTELSIPNDISILKGKEGFSYGTGSDEYYLFTDPECPYCKKFEAYLPQLKKHLKINVFFFPLSFHKDAKELSYFILSHKDKESQAQAMFKAEASNEDFKNRSYKSGEKGQYIEMVDNHLKLGAQLGVRGTPTIYDSNGKSIVWTSLLEKYNIK